VLPPKDEYGGKQKEAWLDKLPQLLNQLGITKASQAIDYIVKQYGKTKEEAIAMLQRIWQGYNKG
jgi:hypothetical protein